MPITIRSAFLDAAFLDAAFRHPAFLDPALSAFRSLAGRSMLEIIVLVYVLSRPTNAADFSWLKEDAVVRTVEGNSLSHVETATFNVSTGSGT